MGVQGSKSVFNQSLKTSLGTRIEVTQLRRSHRVSCLPKTVVSRWSLIWCLTCQIWESNATSKASKSTLRILSSVLTVSKYTQLSLSEVQAYMNSGRPESIRTMSLQFWLTLLPKFFRLCLHGYAFTVFRGISRCLSSLQASNMVTSENSQRSVCKTWTCRVEMSEQEKLAFKRFTTRWHLIRLSLSVATTLRMVAGRLSFLMKTLIRTFLLGSSACVNVQLQEHSSPSLSTLLWFVSSTSTVV